jgi:phenylacetate-CoA ligase
MALRNHFYYGFRFALRDNALCAARVRTLLSHESWNSARLDDLRDKLLERTLLAAHRRLPAYAATHPRLRPCHIVSFLRENYPIVDKTDLLTQREHFYPYNGRSLPWLPKGKTSGTTGTPLEIFRSVNSLVWENAFIKRHWFWAGFTDGMKRATLRGDHVVPLQQTRPPFWLYNRFNNQLLISSRHLSHNNLGPIVDALRRFGPYLLQAYPSTAFTLARYLERIDEVLDIPYVFTGSEMLYSYQRELIEARIGKVLDFYGMAERVAFASECEFGNLHVNSDYSFVEIVDEAGRPTDEYGFIVGTTFHNLAMPLIRYQVSDRTRWKPGACACGRSYPMIEPIAGKFEDTIFGSDGNVVSPSIITFAFKGVLNIANSQVAQVGPGAWEIRIVPMPSYSEADGQQLKRNIASMVDPRLDVRVKIVQDIPRTLAGKYRWVVNESPVDGPGADSASLQRQEEV